MVNHILHYIDTIGMKITKTVNVIVILAVIAVITSVQAAQASNDSEKTTVKITLKGIDSITGNLQVEVIPQEGDSKTRTINPFQEGYAGNVQIRPFKFSTDELDNNQNVQVCVYSLDHGNVFTCDNEYVEDNTAKLSLVIPGVPQERYNEPTYYDEDGNVIPSSYVKQGDDSTTNQKNKDQDSGVNVSFGDNSDNNKATIDQRSTFADVIRDIVPIAKEGAHMAKDTTAQLLN